MKTLILNADYTPLNIVSWKKAMTMLLGFNEPVFCLEYDSKSIRDSVGRQYKLPSVLILKSYVHVDHNKTNFSKINVYYRDRFKCCYCGATCKKEDLTIDHIIPKSRWKNLGNKGSSNIFENTVTACFKCNIKKGNRTPKEAGMPLLVVPKKVTKRQAFINRINMLNIPNSWMKYLEEYINVRKAVTR